MPRAARIAPNEHVYHILTRGNNRQNVFRDEKDYKRYIDILRRFKEKYRFKLYHYVLMSNHVHLVLETTQKGGQLSDIMKGINLSYVLHYKKRHGHIGHFWQDRYKSILISKDDYLLACGSYVELNPVRAKIAANPKEYKWSSYNVYAYGKKDGVTDEHPIYDELAQNETGRRKSYRDFVKGMIRDRDAMKGDMDKRAVYGSRDFVKSLTAKYNINEITRHAGRPRTKKDDN